MDGWMDGRERMDGWKGEEGGMEGGGWALSLFVVVMGGRACVCLWVQGACCRQSVVRWVIGWWASLGGLGCCLCVVGVIWEQGHCLWVVGIMCGQWASCGGRGCHLGAVGIIWGWGRLFGGSGWKMLFVDSGGHLGVRDVICGQWASFGGEECHLGAGDVIWGGGRRLGAVGII